MSPSPKEGGERLTQEMDTHKKRSSPTPEKRSSAAGLAEKQNPNLLPARSVDDMKGLSVSKLQAMQVPALIEIDEEELDRDFDLRMHTPSEQRAQSIAQIFAKYGLQHAADDMYMRPKPQVERVERKPRLRVHYICHECNATFGHDRTCKSCAHQRCRDCTRYPPKKSNKDKAKTKRSLNVSQSLKPTAPPDLTKGPCHECQTEFTIGDRECANCHHKICKKCLAEAVENAS